MAEPIHQVGKLCLVLDGPDGPVEHCVGLATGEDPYNATDMATYATAWVVYVASVLPSTFTISQWRSKDPMGARAAEGTFSSVALGTHGNITGVEPYKSLRGCLSGKTAFPTAASPAGQTRAFIPLYATLDVAPGTREFTPLPDADWQDLRTFLEGNGSLWTDFFGRKAIVRNKLTVQFNAYMQGKVGS